MDSESSETGLNAAIVAAQLDATRDLARAAYFRRDVGGVMAMFHPTLMYRRPDGLTLDYERFARELSVQLARLETSSTEFRREALDLRDPVTLTEALEERTTFVVRAFGFLRREWTVSRRALYQWVRIGATWRVSGVDVLRETITGRLSIGLGTRRRPQSPSNPSK